MSITTWWERTDLVARRQYYVRIERDAVVVGTQGDSVFTDGAGSCTHAEFLAGSFHDLVARDLGPAILAEVIHAVQNAASHLQFRAERERIARLRAYLDSIPFEIALRGFDERPGVEKGSDNYGNGGNTRTLVRSETVTLVANLDGNTLLTRADLTKNDGGGSQRVALGFVEHAVACRDRFYLCMAGSFRVLDSSARSYRRESDAQMFGDTLRIGTVFRHANDVCFRAAWFSNTYPHALLRCTESGELVGRWEP